MEKTFHITTFGCQMNEHDSEIMAGMLEARGLRRAPDRKSAQIEIINTCSVRDNADKRFFGTLGQLKRRKTQDPDFTVCVCGCMMQQQRVVDRIQEKYPWVDLVFGTNNLHRLPDLLDQVLTGHDKEIEIWQERSGIAEGLPAERMFRHKALVNITFGCNNFCTYCIVPYTRGREESRHPEEILKEIRQLAEDGVREVTLLGQNVNSYRGRFLDPATGEGVPGGGLDPGVCTFAQLIRLTAKIPGIERIRFMTSHPKDLSPALIQTFVDVPELCRNIHLPVQAGSDRILKRMNRHYDSGKYLRLVRDLRAAVPDITMSTDIIVGFPGETEEDFQATLDLVEKVGYDSAFTFLYSIRQGTPAAEYPDQVPDEVKHERFDRLVELVNRISAEKDAACEGKIYRILVDGPSKRDRKAMAGRTDGFKLVNFSVREEDLPEESPLRGRSPQEIADLLTGRFADVIITKGKTFSLEGRFLGLSEEA